MNINYCRCSKRGANKVVVVMPYFCYLIRKDYSRAPISGVIANCLVGKY